MIVPLLAIGLVSMLGQVVLLRELHVAFYGSELLWILALGMWLTWSALGAAAGRWTRSLPDVHVLLLALAWILPLAVVFTRSLRRLFGGVPGAFLPFPQQLVAMGVALLPVAFVLGLLFVRAAKTFLAGSGTPARAYAIESVGGVAGGALATSLLREGVSNFASGLVCALACLAATSPGRDRRHPALLAGTALTAILLLAALIRSESIDLALTARNHPALLASRDSPYGRVTVTETAGQLSVFENDALAFESQGTGAEEFVHLAAIQHPDPRRVLVLGGGVEGLVGEMLRHDPDEIVLVELDPVLLELASTHLPDDFRRSLDDPAVRVVHADPRRFLERAGRYDLILVGMPEPESGRTNRFYTREFFRACAHHLEPEGILAFRLRGAENLWTPARLRRAAGMHRALRDVFADAVVLPGVTNVFLASDAKLDRDPAALAARLGRRGIEPRLVIPAYVEYLYTNDRFARIAEDLAGSTAPANRDARPVCYGETLLLWLSRFAPAAAGLELPDLAPGHVARSPRTWVAAAVAVAGFLLARRRSLLRRALLVALAGFAGMVLETTLLLGYQTSRGVLYQDLGVLLTAFMAGLALGAGAVDTALRDGAGRHGPPGRRLPAHAEGVLVVLLAALALAVARVTGAGGGGLLAAAAGLAATGFLVAAVFAVAAQRGPDPRAVISPLYAADLLGGGAGSLAASLLLVPAAGLPETAGLTAVAVLLGLLLA